jgi:hypothetical protein
MCKTYSSIIVYQKMEAIDRINRQCLRVIAIAIRSTGLSTWDMEGSDRVPPGVALLEASDRAD